MKVTVVQLSNDQAQLEKEMRLLSEHVQSEKSEFVLLPEMTFAPWLANTQNADAGKWQAAMQLHAQWIDQLASLNMPPLVSTRPTVNGAGSRRNQAYLWDREQGAQPIHEKYYLPNEEGYWEASWYDMGDPHFDTARLGEVRIGVQICTEMWFFEHAREFAQKQVDLLCVPRVTPHGSVDKWLAGGQAAAVVSGAYHLSSNMYLPTSSEAADIGGLSWIVSPEGDILATTNPDQPFITIDIDIAASAQAKHNYPRYVKT